MTIIASDQKENKLIFSEKNSDMEEIKDMVSKYKIGDIVEEMSPVWWTLESS